MQSSNYFTSFPIWIFKDSFGDQARQKPVLYPSAVWSTPRNSPSPVPLLCCNQVWPFSSGCLRCCFPKHLSHRQNALPRGQTKLTAPQCGRPLWNKSTSPVWQDQVLAHGIWTPQPPFHPPFLPPFSKHATSPCSLRVLVLRGTGTGRVLSQDEERRRARWSNKPDNAPAQLPQGLQSLIQNTGIK